MSGAGKPLWRFWRLWFWREMANPPSLKLWRASKPPLLLLPKLLGNSIMKDSKRFDKKIENSEIKIVFGTHALIQKYVKFKDLALVIIDEQHRFGVKQRSELLKNKCSEAVPHLLSMSATPIPRTLSLTVFSDLDLSIIDELPKGRKEIITKIVAPINRDKAYTFILGQVKKGRQVFVICPRIEPT